MTVQGRYPVPAKYGDRVMYRSKRFGRGVGTFYLCWMGLEEVWEVRRDDGTKVTLFPCFGDRMLAITTMRSWASTRTNGAPDSTPPPS